jgi:hypothetical protein
MDEESEHSREGVRQQVENAYFSNSNPTKVKVIQFNPSTSNECSPKKAAITLS